MIDAAGLETFALLGMSQGGPVAIAYALRHPERVTRLILHGSYTASLGPTPESAELEDAFTRMIEVGWARPEGRFRRVFTDMLMPGATPEEMSWVDDLMRMSTSTANAVAFRQQRRDVDVGDLLPRVTLPTLVLHARGDQCNDFSEGRRLAAEIPGVAGGAGRRAGPRSDASSRVNIGILDTCRDVPSRYLDRMPFGYPALPSRR